MQSPLFTRSRPARRVGQDRREKPTPMCHLPLTGYKGHDSYAIKVCATVQKRSGCSSLTHVPGG